MHEVLESFSLQIIKKTWCVYSPEQCRFLQSWAPKVRGIIVMCRTHLVSIAERWWIHSPGLETNQLLLCCGVLSLAFMVCVVRPISSNGCAQIWGCCFSRPMLKVFGPFNLNFYKWMNEYDKSKIFKFKFSLFYFIYNIWNSLIKFG